MGACRENFSIWWRVKLLLMPPSNAYFGRWKRFKELTKMRVDNRWFWHDSFGRYINKYFVCPVFKHKQVQWLEDGNCCDERPKHYCFDCESEVDPGISRIRKETIRKLDFEALKDRNDARLHASGDLIFDSFNYGVVKIRSRYCDATPVSAQPREPDNPILFKPLGRLDGQKYPEGY